MKMPRYLVVAALFAVPALAQQPPGAPAKTTEQQARSYVASSFITGAAPTIMSEKVIVSPALQQRLGVPPAADGSAVYKAIMDLTGGKRVQVRRAAADEVAASEAPAPVSEQPIFAMEAGDTTILVQYDLGRDNISFVGLPGVVATAAPVVAPTPPQKVPDTPPVAAAPEPAAAAPVVVADTPKPAPVEAAKPEPAVAPQPAPEVAKPQSVEPQIPRAHAPQAVMSMQEPPRQPPLRKSGPCEIKPVMTDQDLVNCGATPH